VASSDDILSAIEANIVVTRRLYDVQLLLLHAENEDAAKKVDEAHSRGEYLMSDIILGD